MLFELKKGEKEKLDKKGGVRAWRTREPRHPTSFSL